MSMILGRWRTNKVRLTQDHGKRWFDIGMKGTYCAGFAKLRAMARGCELASKQLWGT
jgi:hypothetical protein